MSRLMVLEDFPIFFARLSAYIPRNSVGVIPVTFLNRLVK